MHIDSPAFEQHQPIPKKYTCEGDNISPPLTFNDLPKNTKSLALIMDDPDAPSGTIDHWIAWNLSPDNTDLSEGAAVPKEGKNSYKVNGYKGPCPPPGKAHRYFFKLYALDSLMDLPVGMSKKDLEKAIEGHVLGKAELVGTYQRH